MENVFEIKGEKISISIKWRNDVEQEEKENLFKHVFDAIGYFDGIDEFLKKLEDFNKVRKV